MSNPIYDELEAKWNDVNYDKHICDTYWRVYQPQTGQEWYEDYEGNEVFPEPTYAYLSPQDVKVGDAVTPIKLGEPEFSVGGYVGNYPDLHKAIFEYQNYCPASNVSVDRHKPKFKLFGRNQGTRGTV